MCREVAAWKARGPGKHGHQCAGLRHHGGEEQVLPRKPQRWSLPQWVVGLLPQRSHSSGGQGNRLLPLSTYFETRIKQFFLALLNKHFTLHSNIKEQKGYSNVFPKP